MNNVATSIERVRQRIAAAATAAGRSPDAVSLLAVSKTKPATAIRAAIAAGQRAFGENYLQDALPKIAELADEDLEWHFIGRIQSNKTHDIASQFAWVHGLSDLRHAERLSRQRPDDKTPLQVCLQVNLSGESTKGGVTAEALSGLAKAVAQLPRLRLRGLMTMPDPDTTRVEQRAVFHELATLKERLTRDGLELDTLSMGMSRDLEDAVAEGSTMVRIGTDIFGPRD